MVLSMPKIMFEVIALGFEDIMVLIFGLPSASPCPDHIRNRGSGQFMASNERIVVKHFTVGLTGNGELTPINKQSGLSLSEGNLISIVITINYQ